MNFLEVENNSIAKILCVNLLGLISETSFRHVERKVHLVCNHFGCHGQKLAEEIKAMNAPAKLI